MSIKPLGRQVSTKSLMREALEKGDLVKEGLSNEEYILVFWMI